MSCYTTHVRIFANVPIQPQTRLRNIRTCCGPTTTLSEVPATATFGHVRGGADRVSVKNLSEDSDYVLCLMAELADLPDVAMDLVFAEFTK